MLTAIKPSCRNGGLAELADAYALGAYDLGHEGSTPLSPTSNKASEVTILDNKFVARDVAFDKKCCSKMLVS